MKVCFLAFTFLLGLQALATDVPVGTSRLNYGPNPAPFGMTSGYTDNVDDEVNSEPEEMILLEKPESLKGPNLHDQIFNSQLSQEFLFRYQQQFGQTEAESNYFLTSRQGYYFTPTGPIATDEDAQRRAFAEYMLRRLAEFHTENIMKTDPQFKRVYEIKQQVSNVNLEVSPGYKLDMTYSFVGNFMVTRITNPFAPATVSVNMDPSSLFPTAPREVYVQTSKQLSLHVTGDCGYTFYDRAFRVAVTKAITPTMVASVSESLHLSGLGIDYSREGLSLVGFGWTF